MDIPFKLTFFPNNSTGEEFKWFADSLELALDKIEDFSFSCKELQDLRVKFESTVENIDLWIEIMDMLPLESFKGSEKEIERFLPSAEMRGLYLNSNSYYNTNRLEYSTLLPGVYRMIVRENNTDKYFAFLKVGSKQINEEQLSVMRNEVEDILSGLAKEVATKRNLTGNDSDYDNNDLLQKYHFLVAQADKLIINIKLIIGEPRYKIEKKYISKPVGQAVKNDMKTTKLSQSKSRQIHKISSFNYEINYDISVNNNLKNMIEHILKDTLMVEKYIDRNIELLQKDLEIQTKFKSPVDEIERKIGILSDHRVKIGQLKANLTFTLRQHWIEKLSSNMNNQDKLPRIPYYRTVYSLYQQMNRSGVMEVNPLQYYIYSWKETSKLYEIWGFLKLLLMLKENSSLKINDASGWIFDSASDKIYPLLTPNTKVVLSNLDGLKLIVRYDSFISKSNERSHSIEDPLITVENNNRPDFRLDIYYKDSFKGSILADFKYRSLGKLGNPDVYINNRYSDQGYKVYSQLMGYTYARTFYLNSDSIPKRTTDFAVQRVFGIFPKNTDDSVSNSYIPDEITNITRCSLSPGFAYDKIENEFIEIIEDITTR
ncbi:hypothetical protein B1B04_20005 [Lysinibacillus sp. KCTC 33748]|uniref:nuclease domain-containing protein n=1 Tax=unclassified Lysinibacillus TaxID=2636778 RepID=UPI0009A6E351|nr:MULTISPECIES: nuclease domain-containing protein [unclassified Lysinibacillus]OXS68582.1 hypothetical protein B1B04_20005 [Lysinibacillus sp. KCTC 33748]SKC08898.1 PD-(D/E)XK nuclease superfamily protein [Lysinibacillus sp. AC-3]